MKNYETYSTKDAWEPIPFSGEKNKHTLEKLTYEPVTKNLNLLKYKIEHLNTSVAYELIYMLGINQMNHGYWP